MRVIGGEFRSRALKSVPGLDTRPTPDRMREALFNILAPRIEGSTFADLYAGTGAVGIEALSRGARRVIFVESNPAALTVIRQNLKSLGAEARADIRQGKATALGGKIHADIVFLDPPYNLESEYEAVLAKLAEWSPSLVVVQHDKRLKLPTPTRTVKQGDNCLSFFERQ